MKPTRLLYLEDTYRAKCEAEITNIEKVEGSENLWSLNCDQTVFYPQGGGQAYDLGWIRFMDDMGRNTELEVNKVELDKETSVVNHYFNVVNGMRLPEVGSKVEMEVDMERRILMSNYHTVGHMIDLVAARGKVPGLSRATRGDHVPGKAYLKFEDVIDLNEMDYAEVISEALNDLKNEALAIIAVESDGVTEGAPEGKIYREVYFEGNEEYGVGCGGTHIENTSEVGEISIDKVRCRKGSTTIKYSVEV